MLYLWGDERINIKLSYTILKVNYWALFLSAFIIRNSSETNSHLPLHSSLKRKKKTLFFNKQEEHKFCIIIKTSKVYSFLEQGHWYSVLNKKPLTQKPFYKHN